jgi:hypothetical protein
MKVFGQAFILAIFDRYFQFIVSFEDFRIWSGQHKSVKKKFVRSFVLFALRWFI